MLRALQLAALLALPIAGCQTTIDGRSVEDKEESVYPSASAFTRVQIERTIHDVPYLQGRAVIDACAFLARIGPAAIPQLAQALSDPEPARRSFALNALGAIGDRRALEQIRTGLTDADRAVRYEAARSCVRLGDWTGMPVLVEGLADDSAFYRGLCFDALQRETNLDFGFRALGAEEERAVSVTRWRDWWQRHETATVALQR